MYKSFAVRIFCTLLGAMITQVLYADTNVWSVEGPVGGVILDVSIDPHDENVVYAAATQKLYKRQIPQGNWSIVGDNIIGISSIEYSALTPGTIVLDTFSSSASYISMDAGASFEALYTNAALDERIRRVALSSNDRLIGTPAFSGGIVISDDYGASWTESNAGIPLSSSGDTPMTIRILAAAPSVADRIYAVLNDYQVIRSDDGGESWVLPANQNLPLTLPNPTIDLFVDPLDPDTVMIEGNVAYRTIDAGETWNPIASISRIRNIKSVSSDNTTLYAVTDSGFVSRSDDAGATWVNETLPATFPNAMAIRADGSGSASTTTGVYDRQSTNGQWTLASDGIIASTVYRFVQNASTQRVYAGTERLGVHYTDDGAASWQSAGYPSEPQPNQSIGSVYGLAVTQSSQPVLYGANATDSTIYQSVDEGESWEPTGFSNISTGPVRAIDIAAADPQVIYVGSGTDVFRSDDGGQSWILISPSTLSSTVQSVKVHSLHKNIVVVASQFGGLYQSSDSGENWIQSLPAGPLTWEESTFFSDVDPNRIFTRYDGDIWMSEDAGVNWNLFEIDPGLVGNVILFREHPVNENILYANFNNLGFGRSVDRGLTWHAAGDTLPLENSDGRFFANLLHVDIAEPNRVYAADNDEGVSVYTFARDLQVTPSLEQATLDVGQFADFTFDIANGEEGVAGDVSFSVEALGPVSIVSIEPVNACMIDADGLANCSFLQMQPSTSIPVTVRIDAESSGTAQLTVQSRSTEIELTPSDNTASTQLTLVDLTDTDADGVPDNLDNCTAAANFDQNDVDNDGYGNVCDPDFDQNCVVNFLDIVQFSNAFLMDSPLHDLNNDGAVNFLDFNALTELFLSKPGPSGISSLCDAKILDQ